MRRAIARLACLAALAIAACQARPTYDYRTGEILLEEDFSSPIAWERYASDAAGADLRVENGVYRMQLDGGTYIWGLGSESFDNVVVEAQSTQLSAFENNAYGVICRADPSNNGEGYYFLISADGYWSIRRQSGREMTPLVEFTASDAINRGTGINWIRAVCVDDYLALYINDEFVGETRDHLYSRGFVGFAVAAIEEGEVDVYFDDLRVQEGRLVPPG